MTDPRPYRDQRAAPPEQGPARTEEEESGSLPPGSSTRDEDQRGDVDRAMPYEGDPAPERMRPQPFDADPDAGGDEDGASSG